MFPVAPLSVNIPARVSEDHPRRILAKGHRRAKSVPHPDQNGECESDRNVTSPRPSTSSSRSSVTSHTSYVNSEKAWRSPYHPTQRPPILKLLPSLPASTEQTFRPIPDSPIHEEQSELDAPDSPSSPTFAVASEAATRRKKIRRLTRKLGEGFPIDLVFPTTGEADSDSDEETPLLETPSSERGLPFSTPLPAIPETASDDAHSSSVHSSGKHSVRKTSFANGCSKSSAHRNAVFVVDSPDEHGSGDGLENLCLAVPPSSDKSRKKRAERSKKSGKDTKLVCVGVSASAGQSGKGHSRRWVQGAVPLDQVVGSWGGAVW